MKNAESIEGQFTRLRPSVVSDAQNIINWRTDPSNSKYIHATSLDVKKQEEWMEAQQKLSNDYYFIIETSEGTPIGTIGLYNFEPTGTSEFGRWICNGSQVHVLESALLLHDFGFYKLGLNCIYSCTMTDNVKVVNFHKRFGATFVCKSAPSPERSYYGTRYEIYANQYQTIREKNMHLINKFK